MDKLPINPGTILLVPASKVTGGKRRVTKLKYNGTINGGEGERKEFDVRIETENVEERRSAENLIQRAVQAVRAHSTLTSIGYLADPENLGEVIKKYSEIKLAAERFNATSSYSKVSISFLPIEIGTQLATNEECAKALADHVRGELEKLRDALKIGDVKTVTNLLLGCRRMHTLSVGTQANAIKFAIDEALASRSALKTRINKLSETPEYAGRALVMPMIDAAIETFTYAPENHAPEIPADLGTPGEAEAPAQALVA